jgi:hypothetical protein
LQEIKDIKMKFIFILVIINVFTVSDLLANESVYDSGFFEIKIVNQQISNAKLREIEKVKILSLERILNNILTKENLRLLKKSINIDNEINPLFKNLIIENEFIYSNNYNALIKVNFDIGGIIDLLRRYKINYTDIKSDEILFVISKEDDLTKEGLSSNNILYEKLKITKFGLLNLIIPDLSKNDRFILPYEKILKKNIKAFKKISKKYNTNYTLVANIYSNNDFDLSIFDDDKNTFTDIKKINSRMNLNLYTDFLFSADSWWKEINEIDNSKENNLSCYLKYISMSELNFINNKINSITQVKKFILKKIELGNNLYYMTFFGNLDQLSSKLIRYNILIKKNNDNICFITNK